MESKGKILVVDDDRLVLATVTHGLAQAGYEIIDADNGDDAILLAREHRPDLALLDIRMEGMSGFDVAAYLRESLQTPFMFLSAFSDDATVAQVKALGAVAYLVKPLDIAQIVPTVEAALANVRARRAAEAAASSAAGPASGFAPSAAMPLSPVAAPAGGGGRPADGRRPGGGRHPHAPLFAVAPRGAGAPAPPRRHRRGGPARAGRAPARRGGTAGAARHVLTREGVAPAGGDQPPSVK
jgi:response regulator NasT